MTLLGLDLLWKGRISQKGHLLRHRVLGLNVSFLGGHRSAHTGQQTPLYTFDPWWQVGNECLHFTDGETEAGGGAGSSLGHTVNETERRGLNFGLPSLVLCFHPLPI